MFSLAGKCAVVVGGTSGIGKAIALGLASAGANVVASSRSGQAVESVAGCLESRGAVIGTAIFLAADESAFKTGQIIAVDGGFLASGVNQ